MVSRFSRLSRNGSVFFFLVQSNDDVFVVGRGGGMVVEDSRVGSDVACSADSFALHCVCENGLPANVANFR